MALIKCVECGKEISDRADKCPNCGCPLAMQFTGTAGNKQEPMDAEVVEKVSVQSSVVKKAKWSSGRLVIGIISTVFFLVIAFQSCAAGAYNALSNNGDISGSVGFICALLMLTAGIISIVTKNSRKKTGSIVCTVFYWLLSFFAAVGAGSYSDLRVWGFVAFVFGLVHLLSMAYHSKAMIINCSCTILFFLLTLVIGSTPPDGKDGDIKQVSNEVDTQEDRETIVQGNESIKDSDAVDNTTDKTANTQASYGIGEIADINGTLISMIDYEETNGDEWSEPDEGNIYLYINMNFENNGDEDINISSMLSFENYCDGYKLDYSGGALLSGNYQQLDGTISPGKKLNGSLALEVPADWSEVEVQFTDNVWSDSKVIFVVNK